MLYMIKIAQWSNVLMHGKTFILAMFGISNSKYSISQKLFSKLTTISPRKTQDNFQINIQKNTQIRKIGLPRFQTKKGTLVQQSTQ